MSESRPCGPFAAALRAVAFALLISIGTVGVARAQNPSPSLLQLQGPVTDGAGVIDAASAEQIAAISRTLEQTTGDVVVVATVPTIAPLATIDDYAVKLFDNGGRGIGAKGKDNGVLILLAVQERRVRIEVGYGLEGFLTDGTAGQISRSLMAPRFSQGQYGAGLVAGTAAVVSRIAEGRNVTLPGIEAPVAPRRAQRRSSPLAGFIMLLLLLVIVGGGGRGGMGFLLGALLGGALNGDRRRGPWDSGVGPFGGGFGGGGFGGFGGGRSGGGGGGAGW